MSPFPIPIPDHIADASLMRRVVIGEPGDPTRTDVRPCEYLVGASELYPGRPTVTALVELDDDDRAAIAAGARLWLTLDGGELPWSLTVAPVAGECRTFDGNMSGEFERWLGDAFESWLPDRDEVAGADRVLVRTPDGERTVTAGMTVELNPHASGTCRVHPGPTDNA